MSASAAQYKAQLLEWLRTAVDEGWTGDDEIRTLESLESQGGDALFDPGRRPLTVALFGGTGVGKSSLLNRLVGETIAEVGLERPTSTQVTVYVHREYPLRNLEAFFPVGRVRVVEHDRSGYRDVVWIDMPDIDSVERANRELVFEWLPFIDWLIYVVSPERYRDDAGWRVLQERGHRHHWLFVMNRWDAGTASQLDDFKRLLAADGLGEWPVLKTSCAVHVDDDFPRAAEAIDRAVGEQGLEQLQEVGERARLVDLHRRCEHYTETLGGEAQWRAFIQQGAAVIVEKLSQLNRYVRDEAAIEAGRVPERRAGDTPPHDPSPPALVADYVQDVESAIAVSLEGLPAAPVNHRTRAVLASLDESVAAAVRDGFREGQARPGNAFQRNSAAFMRRLVYGLPLIVSIGIAYVAVTRYRQGLSGTGEFLGFDFLAHSLIILGLAALAPYLLARLMRPSVRRSIVRRVEAALQQLRSGVLIDWRAAMNELFDRSRELLHALDTVRDAIEQQISRSSRAPGG